MARYFQIEKTYYSADDYNAPALRDHIPVLFSSLDEATAYYERHRQTMDWFSEGEDPYFAISEIERSGLEVAYHALPQADAPAVVKS